MTDNEIIKDLEVCSCDTVELALDLINRQKAEIERLKELVRGWKKEAYKLADEKDELYCNAVDRVKTEAVKEFAERVKILNNENLILWNEQIDNLVKEMVGEEDDR